MISVTTPFTYDKVISLRAGDIVTITGTIYTARDAAHKRLIELIEKNKTLPVELEDAIIYFCGPTPTPSNNPIGSAGPTTSGRMDKYSPILIQKCKLRGMIGKGPRNYKVIESMKRNGAVYFAATGGAGALLSKTVVKSEIVCYEDLGPEAIRKLTVKNFPAIVAIDSKGNSLYK